jgi:hypothetical protein
MPDDHYTCDQDKTFSTEVAAYPNSLWFGKKKPQLMGKPTHKCPEPLNFCNA